MPGTRELGAGLAIPWGGITLPCCRAVPEHGANAGGSFVWEWALQPQSHWRAAPGLNGMPKVWCADCMGSSPLSSDMPWPLCAAWEQVRVMQQQRGAWARAVGWGRGRRKGGQGTQGLRATFHPCSTARGTRGIESAELDARNAYKYPQSFSASGRGQPGVGMAEGWGQRGAGYCAPGRLRPCLAAPRPTPSAGPWWGRGGSAMLPGIHRVLGRGKGQSEG